MKHIKLFENWSGIDNFEKTLKLSMPIAIIGKPGTGMLHKAKEALKGHDYVMLSCNELTKETLMDTLRENPDKIILFDEVSKASNDIVNFLKGLADKHVDFKGEYNFKFDRKKSMICLIQDENNNYMQALIHRCVVIDL